MSALELEFLPAALEIEATPPLPAARLMLWAIILFFLIAVAWACIGKLDIVGIAPGKIVPSGRTKTVQPLERSVVADILVVEGQHVNAGEVLVQFDPTTPHADQERLEKEKQALALDRARLTALISAIALPASPEAQPTLTEAGFTHGEHAPPGTDPFAGLRPRHSATLIARQTDRLHQQQAEYRAAIAGINEEIRQKQAERRGIEARIAQLDATLPLIVEEAESHKKLMVAGMVPRVKWLELERDRIEQHQERDVQRNQRTALAAVLASLAQKLEVTSAQYRDRWLSELNQVETRLASYDEELAKAERRIALQTLTAPVAGTVQQLAIHTVGGVVTEAQALMMIVPDDAPIEVEAMVPNKDIGFVHEGQEVIVKVETFNFTKYGYLNGKIRKVSHDAVLDNKQGLNYIAYVALDSSTMEIDGKRMGLAPGMVVSVEVKIGQRRVIEFLLSPLLRYRQESGRER